MDSKLEEFVVVIFLGVSTAIISAPVLVAACYFIRKCWRTMKRGR